MKYIGYIKYPLDIKDLDASVAKMKELQCSEIYLEDWDDTDKTEWKKFIGNLQDGDTAILHSLQNAFKNFNELIFFLKFCSAKSVRIISLGDFIDTADELFDESTKKIFDVFSTIPIGTNDSDDLQSDLISDKKREKKLKKYRLVINMYNAGYSLKEIQAKAGYRSKSPIYRVLHIYEVDLQFPAMRRSRHSSGDDDDKSSS